MTIELTLPDGTARQYPDGTTGLEVAQDIGAGLARAAVAITLDGVEFDLTRPLPIDGAISVITDTTDAGRTVIRHSTAHVLAQAVLDLFEGAHFAIGPPITDGFYYDFDVGRPFTPEDLERIEARMGEIIEADQSFERDYLNIADALHLFSDQPYKTEIIQGVDETEGAASDAVSVYRNNGFADLCRGPHVPSTGRLGSFKLMRSSGAYWRGDEKNAQLQRIYGTAWESDKALAEYLDRLEEAERRDHRKLGAELDLYSFPPSVGSGLAIWHPKGGVLRGVIEDYSRRTHAAHDYDYVYSPHLAKAELWKTSGHLDFYAEGMYPPMELDGGQRYLVKPMNCPFHILTYKSRSRSYRELPLRFFELGTVYRYERSGVVHGLLRVRGMTQDDAHIFVSRDEVADELQRLLDFTLMVLRDFGFEEFEADLSTRDEEKMIGDPELWDIAEAALAAALEQAEIPYEVAPGEATFYGPKIDIHLRDAIGRRWQISTIQLDFAQPDNFELGYATADNQIDRPVMIHRALLGSIERFVAVLVEHYAGAFPCWLAPVQATIVPVADRHHDYAAQVSAELRSEGLRVEVDTADETVGEKLRRAITHKHPAVLVVGDDDERDGTVGLRLREDDAEQRGVPLGDAVSRLTSLCAPPR
jgi:threonyl-tRNA synthetase